MKKLLLLGFVVAACALLSGCFHEPGYEESEDERITGHTFQQVDSYTTTGTDSDGNLVSVNVVETQTITFNADKTLSYSISYNDDFTYLDGLKNLKDMTCSGTYLIHSNNKKILLDIKDAENLSKDCKYFFNDKGELELHHGFMDGTLVLSLTLVE